MTRLVKLTDTILSLSCLFFYVEHYGYTVLHQCIHHLHKQKDLEESRSKCNAIFFVTYCMCYDHIMKSVFNTC